MIKISKLADYGIVLLTIMARNDLENTYTARDLSSQSGLPLPMVSKVLKLMAKGDLLVSHRGVKGGYSLGNSPDKITAADIIAVLDGPIALTSCLDDNDDCCNISAACRMKIHWGLINDKIKSSLETISLSDITHAPSTPFKQ